jgi:hypothetical protein
MGERLLSDQSLEFNNHDSSPNISKKILNQILTSSKLLHSMSTRTFYIGKKANKKLGLEEEDLGNGKRDEVLSEPIKYNLYKGTYLTGQGLSAIANLARSRGFF